MISLPEEKVLYSEIQKKLFYMIPEKWDTIFLYASVIDMPNKRSVGEMYFYYLPKGILKKKYVNSYEIPSLFNIEEEQYSKLITDVYSLIKSLRECFIKTKRRIWSNISISIENFQFKVEYDYEDLANSDYSSYEKHVIWRYQYLKEDIGLLSKKDRAVIDRYMYLSASQKSLRKDVYIEGVYKLPVKNIIDYEKTLTVDEALAQSKLNMPKEKKKIEIIKKNKKDADVVEEEEKTFNNQILNWKK